MTRKQIITKPAFIEAVKAERVAQKERHEKLFAQIKETTVRKLQQMKDK